MQLGKDRYELWRDPDNLSLTFFCASNEPARSQLDPDATLIWECFAASYNEAQSLKHLFLGYEPHIPMDDSETT